MKIKGRNERLDYFTTGPDFRIMRKREDASEISNMIGTRKDERILKIGCQLLIEKLKFGLKG